MKNNPILNAILALVYICAVVSVMFYGSQFVPDEDTILAPITMLSLFTLSAAVMGYLFLSQPLQMYFDGEKKEAVDFFMKTVAVFAGLTIIVVAIFLSGFQI